MFCTRISARVDMSDRGLSHLFESSGASVHVLTNIQKCTGEVSLYFQLELTTLWFLSILTDIKPKDRG